MNIKNQMQDLSLSNKNYFSYTNKYYFELTENERCSFSVFFTSDTYVKLKKDFLSGLVNNLFNSIDNIVWEENLLKYNCGVDFFKFIEQSGNIFIRNRTDDWFDVISYNSKNLEECRMFLKNTCYEKIKKQILTQYIRKFFHHHEKNEENKTRVTTIGYHIANRFFELIKIIVDQDDFNNKIKERSDKFKNQKQ